tara:strand:- start:32 stop:445 length:414 start_codon:yes stop_codon:yes gene_type:complete
MGKKYNSILEFAFSIDHNTLSGEDLSVEDVAKAFYKSIKDIEDQEIFDRVTQCKKFFPFKDTCENDDYFLEESKEDEKDIIKCGGCEQTAEIGEEGFSKEDWTYPWIDILLCDDCYTDVRVEIATKFGIENWGRIDL